jgi:hypothetical protein
MKDSKNGTRIAFCASEACNFKKYKKRISTALSDQTSKKEKPLIA